MAQQGKAPEHERRDWSIILILLLFGFICMVLAGGWAIRFSPNWKLNTNMDSNIDPDSNFLTNRPDSLLEPLDPSILTQPAWINVFLTPGASFPTSAPITSLPTNTPLATSTPLTINTTLPTAIVSSTSTFAIPTNTVFIPPPPTNTPIPPSTPLPQVDLQITKSDGVTTYIANGATTYTIVVTNAGPNSVNGATVVDNFPSQIIAANWTCAPSGGATCTANGSGNINQSVNLPVGSTVTYTVAATIGSGVSGNMANTATVNLPVGYTDPNPGNNIATDINSFVLSADLQITKTDNATDYTAGSTVTYTIVASNPSGPNDMIGATVTDVFPSQVTSATWTCTLVGGAACTAGGSGNINDTVNLPVGSSLTYSITANISASPTGSLINTATITGPTGTVDIAPGNNSSTDTDSLIQSTPFPSGNIGTTNDGSVTVLPPGTSITLTFVTPVTVTAGSLDGFDLIYYELPVGTGIFMDQVILQISDGSNWYTILNWGDGNADTNSNMNINTIGGSETDNRDFTTIPNSDILYPFGTGTLINPATGITIELDGFVPDGTYYYIRIISPTGDDGDGVEVDAIYVVP